MPESLSWLTSVTEPVSQFLFPSPPQLQAGFAKALFLPNVNLQEELAWNHLNHIDMKDWLAKSRNAGDAQRLKAMGNCVVPIMAATAFGKLGKICQLGDV